MGKLLDNLRKKHADTPAKANRHALNFLAHKGDIKDALLGGWTAMQVWEQMIEDGMTTMSYATFCRLAKKHITPTMDDVHGIASAPAASAFASSAPKRSQANTATKKAMKPPKKLTEKENLEILKKEAFAAVRSPTPTGPLIGKPKTREEEDRDLFG